MIDENAFGALIVYYDVEDEEYGLSREEFVERFTEFRESLRRMLREVPFGRGARVLDLGHAWYLEVASGDQTESPLSWAKKARTRLGELGFASAAVVTYGGRWVDEESPTWLETEAEGDAGLVTLSAPSEPLRRALALEAATRAADAEGEPSGWGPGLYLDVEAVEPLGIRLKNEPTALVSGGARFFRVGA